MEGTPEDVGTRLEGDRERWGTEISPREHPPPPVYPLQRAMDGPGVPGSCQPRAAMCMWGMYLVKPKLSEHMLSS